MRAGTGQAHFAIAGSGTQESFPKTRSPRTTVFRNFRARPDLFNRGIVRGIFDEHRSFEKRSAFRAKGSQSCRIRAGARRLRLAVDADCRSRSVESSARPNRGGSLCHHQCRRTSRRRDGDANDAQAGTRTGRPCAEAGSTGKPCDTLGDRCAREGDDSHSASRPQMALCVRLSEY
jgi:hypothetical protein